MGVTCCCRRKPRCTDHRTPPMECTAADSPLHAVRRMRFRPPACNPCCPFQSRVLHPSHFAEMGISQAHLDILHRRDGPRDAQRGGPQVLPPVQVIQP